MSRIGKQPITIPANVNVSIDGSKVTLESGGKSLSINTRPEVDVAWEKDNKQVVVTISEENAKNKQVRAYWGLTRALIQNMVVGVTKGYQKKLEIVGVGWGAQNTGKTVDLKVGFANVVKVPILEGVDVKVEKMFLTITGPDKQKVGQMAADIRSVKKPEPYKGKGIKYTDEVVRRKQGKVFGS